MEISRAGPCACHHRPGTAHGVWRGGRQTQQMGEKGRKEQKNGARLQDSSREGWKVMSREEEKPERNTAYFCKQENAPRQQGGPKAVPGAPTQCAVINPWVTGTESPSGLPGSTSTCTSGRARSPQRCSHRQVRTHPLSLPGALLTGCTKRRGIWQLGSFKVKSSTVTSAIHYRGYLMIFVLLLIKLVMLCGGSQGGLGALPKAVNALSSIAGC